MTGEVARCTRCAKPLVKRLNRTRLYCADCRRALDLERRTRALAFDSFEAFCSEQRRRIAFSGSCVVKKKRNALRNEPSPLIQDHDVITRGRC